MSSRPSSLPRTPEEVTPDRLSAALSGAPIRGWLRLASRSITARIRNAKLGVAYDEADGLPETFFLKMLPLDPETEDDQPTGMGRREALFYRHLADSVPMRVLSPTSRNSTRETAASSSF